MDKYEDAEMAEHYYYELQEARKELAEKDKEIERLRKDIVAISNIVIDKEKAIKNLVALCLSNGIISRGLACQYLGCGREELDEILDKVATNKQNITVYDADTLLKEEGMAKKNDVCRCIARVYRWGALRPHRCSNPVWKDGYCKTHHMKIPAVTKEEEGDERN